MVLVSVYPPPPPSTIQGVIRRLGRRRLKQMYSKATQSRAQRNDDGRNTKRARAYTYLHTCILSGRKKKGGGQQGNDWVFLCCFVVLFRQCVVGDTTKPLLVELKQSGHGLFAFLLHGDRDCLDVYQQTTKSTPETRVYVYNIPMRDTGSAVLLDFPKCRCTIEPGQQSGCLLFHFSSPSPSFLCI